MPTETPYHPTRQRSCYQAIAFNILLQHFLQWALKTGDGGRLQWGMSFFSLAYWIMVILIGLKRWQQYTATDLAFFLFGQIGCMWFSISIWFRFT